MIFWRVLLQILLSLALVACVASDPYFGGPETGPDNDDGIGGTGRTRIASTPANMLVVGEISAFGSLIVNGEKIHYDSTTAVTVNGVPTKFYKFKIGEITEIVASSGIFKKRAIAIAVTHNVVGKVDSINTKARVLTLAGQTVLLTNKILLPKVGQGIEVSGFRDASGKIRATYVGLNDATLVTLVGKVRISKGDAYIGNAKLRLHTRKTPRPGEFVRVRGAYSNGVLQVEKLRLLSRSIFLREHSRILVQGYLQRERDGRFTIDGVSFRQSDNQIGAYIGKFIILEIVRTVSGELVLRRVLVATGSADNKNLDGSGPGNLQKIYGPQGWSSKYNSDLTPENYYFDRTQPTRDYNYPAGDVRGNRRTRR